MFLNNFLLFYKRKNKTLVEGWRWVRVGGIRRFL